MKKISIVVPMYYEEEVARECYNRLKNILDKIENYNYELIFINDGSKDKTLSILEEIAKKDENVKIISFSRNFGHQCAVTAGLQYVTGDAIVIIDADLQDPPELIPEMLKLWEEGNEVIYGKRKSRDGESKFKLLTASMFYKTLNALSDVDIPKDISIIPLRNVIVTIKDVQPAVKLFQLNIYDKIAYIKMITDIAIEIIPIVPTTLSGFVEKLKIPSCANFNIFFNGYLVFPAGWTSLMVTMTFLSGMILISLWMIGEYIGRIYDETKRRPQYIIERTINVDKK